ncbi:MAG TPA: ABC transporter substrate-binding protein [Acidimicrobiia bacterium]|nr:ABC transporter substrate-binding protein [Acidimicrobiia bacterium]
MRQRRIMVIALGVVLGLVASAAAAAALRTNQGAAPQATDVGITPSTIRLAVVADVETPLAPGLFRGSPTAVQAFAQYINQSGGLAGRHLAVDFIDSHLSSGDARNAIITACSQDFAVVGTAALFLNNVDDMVSCKDQAGAATGLPDLPIVTTEVAEQCSPVSFPVNPSQLDCTTKDQRPQTYRANVGTVKYFERAVKKNLHGISVYQNDLKSAAVSQLVLARGSEAAGVKSDGEIGVSATAPQSGYTPAVQAMKNKSSNYALSTGQFAAMVYLRKEADLQGINRQSVVWDCFSPCYDKKFVQQGGPDVEGQYVTLAQLPFEEAKQNKTLANYIKFAGQDKIDGFGAYAWIASVLFRDAVNAVVKQGGNNALTRKALLGALRSVTSFNADGMWGPTNIAAHIPSPCFLIMQLRNGQFKRLYPSKPGTFDCKPSNQVQLRTDLQGG